MSSHSFAFDCCCFRPRRQVLHFVPMQYVSIHLLRLYDDSDYDDDDSDCDDDIYIMMKCVCVCLSQKNDHFLLGVSCNHL